jgi:hypothetical protein
MVTMAPGLLNEAILTHAFSLEPIDVILVLLLAFLSTGAITKIIGKDESFENKSVKDTYLTLNFFAFLFVFFAFTIFLKEVEYSIGIIFLLVGESLFWHSLKFSRNKGEDFYSTEYHYNSIISYVNTSLISLLYLLFIFIVLIESNFSINESNANIFGTLLLIAVFKTLYGINIDQTVAQFIQLHVYSYLFIFIAIMLTTASWITSSFLI